MLLGCSLPGRRDGAGPLVPRAAATASRVVHIVLIATRCEIRFGGRGERLMSLLWLLLVIILIVVLLSLLGVV